MDGGRRVEDAPPPVIPANDQSGAVALSDGGQTDSTAKRLGLDRERELGEGRRQLAPRVDIHTELVVASVEVLHEGMSCADYSR
jgi:hypothetical protein